MNTIRRGLLEAADNVSFIVQNAGKSFGFLEDGRDLVEVLEGDTGQVARLRDHADEGWPAVETALPPGARFQHAITGPLTRAAAWTVAVPETDVIEDLAGRPDAPRFEPRAGGGAVAALEPNARLTVCAARSGGTMLVLKQVRDPDAIPRALRKRAMRWS